MIVSLLTVIHDLMILATVIDGGTWSTGGGGGGGGQRGPGAHHTQRARQAQRQVRAPRY